MKYILRKNAPRSMDKVITGPTDDARWREVHVEPDKDGYQRINRLDQHTLRLAARPNPKGFRCR